MKNRDETIDELLEHYKYREDYTKKKEGNSDYEYENGCIRTLLWVLEKGDD